MSARLAPSMTADTQFFWDGAQGAPAADPALRALRRRCVTRRGRCARSCHSLEWDTIEASGRGTVYSFVMPRHPPLPWFDDGYIVALVELDEGTRLVTNLVGRRARGRDDRHAGAGALRGRSTTDSCCRCSRRRRGVSGARATLDWHARARRRRAAAMVIDVTPTRVVAGAIASRDFMPVHHDRDYANQQGAPDIFMNILSDTGYCSRFLTDWAGPDAMIKRLAIRLGVPVFPGHTLTYTGEVTAVDARTATTAIVDVELRAMNELGEHVGGTATLTVPAGSTP